MTTTKQELSDWFDAGVKQGAMHMLDKGYEKGWGLGRHVIGSNFFQPPA